MYRMLFLAGLCAVMLFAAPVRAQQEATVTLTARVLPSSGAGSSTGAVLEEEQDVGEGQEGASVVDSSDPEQQAGQVTDDEQPDEALDESPGATAEESSSSEPPKRPRRHLAVTGKNQVLIEVQTPTAVRRSIMSFTSSSTERVEIGTLEEDTTVDIAHLSI